MTPTDTTEKGLETLIVRYMTGSDGLAVAANRVAETAPPYQGTGYTNGSPQGSGGHRLSERQAEHPPTARLAHDQALGKVMQLLLKDDTQVYKQFVENEYFRRFVGDMVYALTGADG